jgi:hypothetical protein
MSTRGETPQRVALLPRPVVRALLVTTALLGLASAAVQVSRQVLDHGNLLGLTPLLDMRLEGNLGPLVASLTVPSPPKATTTS